MALLLGAVGAARAAGGRFPDEPFNGMTIHYDIQGVQLGAPRDEPGFTTRRSYRGQVLGPVLRVAGSVSQVNGYGASLRVTVQAGSESRSFTAEGSTPWTQAYDLSGLAPKVAQSQAQARAAADQLVADLVVVSGTLHRDGRVSLDPLLRLPGPADSVSPPSVGPYCVELPSATAGGSTATPTPPPLYRDDFSNPVSGWSVLDEASRRHAYVDGEYQMLSRKRSASRPRRRASAAIAASLRWTRALPARPGGRWVWSSASPMTGSSTSSW